LQAQAEQAVVVLALPETHLELVHRVHLIPVVAAAGPVVMKLLIHREQADLE
jgi:hypothetical protein